MLEHLRGRFPAVSTCCPTTVSEPRRWKAPLTGCLEKLAYNTNDLAAKTPAFPGPETRARELKCSHGRFDFFICGRPGSAGEYPYGFTRFSVVAWSGTSLPPIIALQLVVIVSASSKLMLIACM